MRKARRRRRPLHCGPIAPGGSRALAGLGTKKRECQHIHHSHLCLKLNEYVTHLGIVWVPGDPEESGEANKNGEQSFNDEDSRPCVEV